MKVCAKCEKELTDSYYQSMDNFLQVKYFDSEECNVFCNEFCFAEFCLLEEVFPEEE